MNNNDISMEKEWINNTHIFDDIRLYVISTMSGLSGARIYKVGEVEGNRLMILKIQKKHERENHEEAYERAIETGLEVYLPRLLKHVCKKDCWGEVSYFDLYELLGNNTDSTNTFNKAFFDEDIITGKVMKEVVGFALNWNKPHNIVSGITLKDSLKNCLGSGFDDKKFRDAYSALKLPEKSDLFYIYLDEQKTVLPNPYLYFLKSGNQKIDEYQGVSHYDLHGDNIIIHNSAPRFIDFVYKEAVNVFYDIRYLEVHLLMDKYDFKEKNRWYYWIELCDSLTRDMYDVDIPNGQGKLILENVLIPLRKEIAYLMFKDKRNMHFSPAFFVAGVAAGLNYFRKSADINKSLAAFIYSAYNLKRLLQHKEIKSIQPKTGVQAYNIGGMIDNPKGGINKIIGSDSYKNSVTIGNKSSSNITHGLYDFVKAQDEVLYSLCIKMEKKLKTEPTQASRMLRDVIEKYVGNCLSKMGKGPGTDLHGSIKKCFEKSKAEQWKALSLHSMRDFSNNYNHNLKTNVSKASARDAIKNAVALHQLLFSEAFILDDFAKADNKIKEILSNFLQGTGKVLDDMEIVIQDDSQKLKSILGRYLNWLFKENKMYVKHQNGNSKTTQEKIGELETIGLLVPWQSEALYKINNFIVNTSNGKEHNQTRKHIPRLYAVMKTSSTIWGKVYGYIFDEDMIMIGDYKPIEVLDIDYEEGCEKKYKCIYVDNVSDEDYYVVRQYRRGEILDGLFVSRGKNIQNKLTDEDHNYHISYHNIDVEEDNELLFKCYSLKTKEYFLNDLDMTDYSVLDRLLIIRKIANNLIEMHSEHIYHRALTPSVIHVSSKKNQKFSVRKSGFEYSKDSMEEDPKQTVLAKVQNRTPDNFYAPELNIARSSEDVDWSKVDIYALGVIVLYVFDIKENPILYVDDLEEEWGLSEEFTQIIDLMVENDPSVRPNLETIISCIENEINQHN